MRLTLPVARLTAAAIALVVAVGCGAPDGGAAAHTNTLRVTERDFRIDAPKTAGAGVVTFMVRRGTTPLPLRADDTTIDEEALEPVTAGALEPADAGGTRALRVRLAP